MIGCAWNLLRGMVTLALVVVSGLVLAFVLSAVLMPSDWISVKYDTYQDVLADDGIKRGWIPEFLPERATRISDRHDIDTNELWIEFSFSGGFEDFTAGLERVPEADRFRFLEAQDLPRWWRERAVAFVRCRDGIPGERVPGLLVVAPADGRALYRERLKEAAVAVLDPCASGRAG